MLTQASSLAARLQTWSRDPRFVAPPRTEPPVPKSPGHLRHPGSQRPPQREWPMDFDCRSPRPMALGSASMDSGKACPIDWDSIVVLGRRPSIPDRWILIDALIQHTEPTGQGLCHRHLGFEQRALSHEERQFVRKRRRSSRGGHAGPGQRTHPSGVPWHLPLGGIGGRVCSFRIARHYTNVKPATYM